MFAAIGLPMIPRPRNAMRSSPAMCTTSWCLDSQPIAGPEATRRLRLELLAIEQVATALAVAAAVGPAWRVAAPLREQRVAHVGQRLDLADDAVAPGVPPVAAAAPAHCVLDRAQR